MFLSIISYYYVLKKIKFLKNKQDTIKNTIKIKIRRKHERI